MYFFIGILLLFSFLLLKFVILPWRRQKWYISNFRKQGYRVYEVPFKPFASGLKKIWNLSETTYDAFALIKKEFPNYDVAVLTTLDKTFIEIIHPDLQQEFFSN